MKVYEKLTYIIMIIVEWIYRDCSRQSVNIEPVAESVLMIIVVCVDL